VWFAGLSRGGSGTGRAPSDCDRAAWLLACLALLLPSRDRERFVGEVLVNLADRQQRSAWLAVTLWWAWQSVCRVARFALRVSR
jgi:hypothetical protein